MTRQAVACRRRRGRRFASLDHLGACFIPASVSRDVALKESSLSDRLRSNCSTAFAKGPRGSSLAKLLPYFCPVVAHTLSTGRAGQGAGARMRGIGWPLHGAMDGSATPTTSTQRGGARAASRIVRAPFTAN